MMFFAQMKLSNHQLHSINFTLKGLNQCCGSDPDPDPVGSGLFGSPRSESGKILDMDPDPLSTKRPCNSNFLIL